MKSLFRKRLLEAKKKDLLVSFRTNTEDSNKFSVGYVLSISDTTISAKAINPQGFPGGVIVLKFSDLYGIDIDDRYIKKLKLLEEYKSEIYADIEAPSFFSDDDADIPTILLKAKEHEQMLYVFLYHEVGLYGFIRDLSDVEFLIEVYDDQGEYDGISAFLIEDIKNITWDDEDTRIVNKMRRLKNAGPNM